VYDSISGKLFNITAHREVILSQGTLNTPKTLIFSGIGPAAVLANHSIRAVVVNENVGKNIRNTFRFGLQYSVTNNTNPNLYNFYLEQLKYSETGTGYLASNGQTLQMFIRPNGTEASEVSIGVTLANSGGANLNQININVQICRPQFSDAYININSSNPLDNNLFYFQNVSKYDADVNTVFEGVKAVREIMGTAPASLYFHEISWAICCK